MSRIYITQCSAKKNTALKTKKKRVTPDKLYRKNSVTLSAIYR